MKKIIFLGLIMLLPIKICFAAYGDTETFLGELYSGDGELATESYLDFPEDICADGLGNFYIADTYNHVIRIVNKERIMSTVAGTGAYGDVDGEIWQSEIAMPKGVACDDLGNIVFADSDNNKIKKVIHGQVDTIAKDLNDPQGVKIDGNTVYFLDTDNNALKKVSLNGGDVHTITNDLHGPKKLDIWNGYAFVVDTDANKLVKVNLSNGNIETVAGTGDAGNKHGDCSKTKFRNLWGVVVRSDTEIYVADGTGNVMEDYVYGRGVGFIVKIDTSNNDCQTSIFADDRAMISLNFPNGIDIYENYLYVASTGIGVIYRYDLDDANINERFAGSDRFSSKNGKNPLFGRPKILVAHPRLKRVIFAIDNNQIRRFNTKKKTAMFIAGNIVDSYNDNDDEKEISGEKARFSDLRQMAVSKKGKYLYVVDRNNNRIREINTRTKKVKYLTGAGKYNVIGEEDNGYKEGVACPNEYDSNAKNCAYFNRPCGLVIDNKKHILYVADTDNQVIRKVYLKGKRKGKTKLVAGSVKNRGLVDGIKSAAKFNAPFSLAINRKKSVLYVADRDNHVIRKIRLRDGKVTTIAGNGQAGYQDGLFSEARFSYPLNMVWKDQKLYISEAGSQRIRLLDFKLGVVKLVSGSGERGFKNGARAVAKFNNPNGLVAKKKFLYVADDQNDLIRRIRIDGEAPYTDPAPTISNCEPQSLKYSDYPTGYAMILIHGSNFRYKTKAYFGTFEVTTYVQNDSTLAVNIPIGQMEAGYYEVKVVNSDGQYDKLMRGFSAKEYSGNVPEIDHWTN